MKKRESTVGQEAYAYLEKGWHAEANGCYDDAILFFEGSLAIQETPVAHRCLASVYGTVGELERSNSECWKSIELDPECGDAYTTLGINLIEMGQLDLARQMLVNALNCPRLGEPGLAEETLGRLHEMMGDLMEAMGWYVEALERKPELMCANAHLKRLRYYMN